MWFLLLACAAPWTEQDLSVSSSAVGDDYDVRVLVPEAASEGPWRALVFQDGDYLPRYEQVFADAIAEGAPPFLVIAVGYQGFRTGLTGGLSDETMARRLRDITEVEIEGVAGTGQAAAFQAFLDEELLPEVAASTGLEISEAREDLATWGFSAFGWAATWQLLQGSPTYGGVCAGSPSLRRFDAPILSEADDPAADSLDAWALFTVGDEEVEDAAALDELLIWLDDGDQPGLDVSEARFAGEDHKGAFEPGLQACVEALASRW